MIEFLAGFFLGCFVCAIVLDEVLSDRQKSEKSGSGTADNADGLID